MRVLLKYWLVVVIWMAVIFSASSDRGSWQRSSRILEPLIRWVFPRLPDERVWELVTVGRKCAHLAEYGILGLLLWRALRAGRQGAWEWKTAGYALGIVVLYATSDELHQIFVPTRYGAPLDVLIDTLGAALALLFLWGAGRWRRRW